MYGLPQKADGVLRKTKLCKFHVRGACSKGAACPYAHDSSDLKTIPDLHKTQLCMAFERSGSCRDGVECKYAHGAEELRDGNTRARPSHRPPMLPRRPDAAVVAPRNTAVSSTAALFNDCSVAAALPVGLVDSATRKPAACKGYVSLADVRQPQVPRPHYAAAAQDDDDLNDFFEATVPWARQTSNDSQVSLTLSLDTWVRNCSQESIFTTISLEEHLPPLPDLEETVSHVEEANDVCSVQTAEDWLSYADMRDVENVKHTETFDKQSFCSTGLESLDWPSATDNERDSHGAGSQYSESPRPMIIGDADGSASTKAFFHTRFCRFHRKGLCKKGSGCPFAHEQGSLQSRPDLYRTRLCYSFIRTGECKKGAACKFAHGQEQLRPVSSADEASATDSTFDESFATGSVENAPSSDGDEGTPGNEQPNMAAVSEEKVKEIEVEQDNWEWGALGLRAAAGANVNVKNTFIDFNTGQKPFVERRASSANGRLIAA